MTKENESSVFNNTEIALICETNRSNVIAVRKGKSIDDKTALDKIEAVLGFETALIQLFTDEEFGKLCNVGIEKGRGIKLRTFAVRCKIMSDNLRYRLGLDVEENNNQ